MTLVSNLGASGTAYFGGQENHTYPFCIWAEDRVDNETTQESSYNTPTSVTKYYLFGGQRVGSGTGSAVYYLHGDHLGSVSMTTNAAGEIESQMRFAPFGELHCVCGLTVVVTPLALPKSAPNSLIQTYGDKFRPVVAH